MATNLGVLHTRFRKRIGNVSLISLPEVEAKAYVNTGYMHTLDTFMHPVARKEFTFATVAGVHTYGLPRQYRVLMRLWNATSGKRVYKTTHVHAFDMRDTPSSAVVGIPEVYFKNGTDIRLMPTPNGVFDLVAYCKMKLPDLVDDLAEPEIDDWDEVMLARAAYAYYIDIGDEAKAKWSLAVWKEATNNKPTQLEEETVDLEMPAYTGGLYDRKQIRGSRRYSSDPWRW